MPIIFGGLIAAVLGFVAYQVILTRPNVGPVAANIAGTAGDVAQTGVLWARLQYYRRAYPWFEYAGLFALGVLYFGSQVFADADAYVPLPGHEGTLVLASQGMSPWVMRLIVAGFFLVSPFVLSFVWGSFPARWFRSFVRWAWARIRPLLSARLPQLFPAPQLGPVAAVQALNPRWRPNPILCAVLMSFAFFLTGWTHIYASYQVDSLELRMFGTFEVLLTIIPVSIPVVAALFVIKQGIAMTESLVQDVRQVSLALIRGNDAAVEEFLANPNALRPNIADEDDILPWFFGNVRSFVSVYLVVMLPACLSHWQHAMHVAGVIAATAIVVAFRVNVFAKQGVDWAVNLKKRLEKSGTLLEIGVVTLAGLLTAIGFILRDSAPVEAPQLTGALDGKYHSFLQAIVAWLHGQISLLDVLRFQMDMSFWPAVFACCAAGVVAIMAFPWEDKDKRRGLRYTIVALAVLFFLSAFANVSDRSKACVSFPRGWVTCPAPKSVNASAAPVPRTPAPTVDPNVQFDRTPPATTQRPTAPQPKTGSSHAAGDDRLERNREELHKLLATQLPAPQPRLPKPLTQHVSWGFHLFQTFSLFTFHFQPHIP